jgi:hypothetical protein
MSAIGPKQTFLFAPHISAFGGKADMKIVTALSANPGSERRMDRSYCAFASSDNRW